jgi:hypothetical protein
VVGRKSIGVRVESLETASRSAAECPASAVFGGKFFPLLLCWILQVNFMFDTNGLMAFMLLLNNSIGTAQ